MNILWEGARGPSVKELQEKLKEAGYYAGVVDGIFGPGTRVAVTRLQAEHRIFADGIAGPQTFRVLQLPTPPPGSRPARTRVFISYSHADEKWLRMLHAHLAPLEGSGNIIRWDDTKIKPGQKWREEIAAAIKSAKVAVLLVSSAFIASEFIAENELPPLLNAAERNATLILPVIISPCSLGTLAEFQSVNPPTKPLADLARGAREKVWDKVIEAITSAVNE